MASALRESAIIFGGSGVGAFLTSQIARRIPRRDSGSLDFSKINLLYGIVHLTLSIISYFLLKDVDNPLYASFFFSREKIVAGSDYITDPFSRVFSDFDTPLDADLGTTSFFAVTALAHFTYANSNKYKKYIAEGHNPYRWVEYSISASIMIYLTCMLGGIRDLNSIIPIIGSNILCMYAGYGLEESILKKDFEAARRFLIVGWISQVYIWSTIIMNFILRVRDIQNIKNPSTGEPYYRLPSWIYLVILVSFINFTIFGIVAVSWYKKSKTSFEETGQLPSYEETENRYLTLSLFAKVFLGLGILVGYRTRGNIEDILA